MRFIIIVLFIFALQITNGCKKFIEVTAPKNSLNAANVFNNDETAIAVVNGIYSKLVSSSITTGGMMSLSFLPGLSCDELTLHSSVTSPDQLAYYRNNLKADPLFTSHYWSNIYPVIFAINDAIEGLNASNTLSLRVKNILLGETKFIRAFCYFQLVNLYGDIPLVLSTDYVKNSGLTRITTTEVYSQIISDLKESQNILSSVFLNEKLKEYPAGLVERVRPNKWAATALLAKVYLYIGDNNNASSNASLILEKQDLFTMIDLDEVFLKNSNEAIWQLQPTNPSRTTASASLFILDQAPNPFSKPTYINNDLINSFSSIDKRLEKWIGKYMDGANTYYFPFKYKNQTPGAAFTEYEMVFRIAEVHLIMSEAEIKKGNVSQSLTHLNLVRERAGLADTVLSNKESILGAILLERRHELFTEWSNRWFDLKRLNKVDSVMKIITPQKFNGFNWSSHQKLFPIPSSEIIRAPQVIQNNGY